MARPDRVLSMLGLATKAGKIVSGETATENAVKNFEAYLVVIATDASDNTRKHFRDMCEYRDIPYREYGTKEELGHAIGRDYRSNLAITDEGFSRTVTERIDESGKGGCN